MLAQRARYGAAPSSFFVLAGREGKGARTIPSPPMRSNPRRPLRICLVSRELAPFQAGGIGTYVELMARALADAGHDVHLLSQPRPEAASAQRDGRIHHHAVSLEAEEAG